MLRRNSAWGFALLAVASLLLFVPLAAASSSDRPVQTLTLLALACALAACGLTWLALRRRGFVASTYLGLAALAGALSAVWLLRMIPDLRPWRVSELASRLFVIAAFDGVGVWLFVVGLRRVFPRRVRGLGAMAITLLLVGLLAGPSLLLQPGAAFLNLTDVQTQLRAGFLYWTVGATLMVAPFLALMTLPGDWFERWWATASSRFMAIPNRAFAIALAVAVLALAAFFATYSFDRRPTTADEIAQLWHARMLLDGRLAMPPDPNPEFFAIDNIVDRPRWMSQFPIGGPAVLAIGMLAGAVWLLNPILTALMALNVYRFAQRVYGEPQARAVAVVVASSPMVLMMGGTHMNHTPTAFLVTLALAALPLWEAASGPVELRRTAAVIGISISAAFAIRPLDGLIAGLVFGLSMLWLSARARNGARARSLLVAAAVGTIPVVLLLVANWRTTGHPLRFGYEVLWGSNHSLGLHDDPMGNPHTPWRALLLAVKYTVQLNWIATAWPVPVLLIVAAGLALARRPHRWDVLLLSLFGAQLLVYAFYWHDGQFIGPRFLFTVVPPLLILAARAPFVVAGRARGVWWRIAVVIVPVCIGIAWLRTMRPFGVQSLAMEFRESRRRLKQDPPKEVRDGTVQNALIFVQEGASARLLHRLWGVGISRPDAARLLQEADACTLLEAVRSEERRPATDTSGRVRRIAFSTRPFVRSGANIPVADVNFRITDTSSVTQACADEVAHDHRVLNTVAYGSMLLFNRFDDSGRIGGPVVYVMDLRDHNEVLRQRFGNRRWYRYEVPRRLADTLPVLVLYDSAR